MRCCRMTLNFERLSSLTLNGDRASARKTPKNTRCHRQTCLFRGGGGSVTQSLALEFLRWHPILGTKAVRRLSYLAPGKYQVSDDTSKRYFGPWIANRCDSPSTYGRTTMFASTRRPFSSACRPAPCRVTALGRPHSSRPLNNGWLPACRNNDIAAAKP